MGVDPRAQLEGQLAELFNLLKQFEQLEQRKQDAYRRHSHLYMPYLRRWSTGAYWLCTLILTVPLFMIIGSIGSGSMSLLGSEDIAATLGVAFGVLLVPFPLALIGSRIILSQRNKRARATNAEREIQNQEISYTVSELAYPELLVIDQELTHASRTYQSRFAGWFPEKYLAPADVYACLIIVRDHRASTVQEAVNRYMTDQHEEYLRDAARAQLEEQQRSTRVAQFNGIMNAAMQGATIGTIRSEAAATRAAMSAPRTIRFERR